MAPTADTVVVDASVAVKWHLQDEEYADEAAELLTTPSFSHAIPPAFTFPVALKAEIGPLTEPER